MSFRLEIQSPKKAWLSCEEISGFPSVEEIEEGVKEIAAVEPGWAGAYRVVDEQTGEVAKEFAIAPPAAPAADTNPATL